MPTVSSSQPVTLPLIGDIQHFPHDQHYPIVEGHEDERLHMLADQATVAASHVHGNHDLEQLKDALLRALGQGACPMKLTAIVLAQHRVACTLKEYGRPCTDNERVAFDHIQLLTKRLLQ